MDWSKVDAGLAAALADDPPAPPMAVFLHLTEPVEPERIEELGVDAAGEGLVRTATVSPEDVDRLSEQAWVSQLRLSRSLGPLDRA